MALYGLTAPFAAALMERFGIRRVVMCALLVVAVGSGLTVFMTASWQLILLLGRAGRPGHRLDGAVAGGHGDRPLVRRPPRAGLGHPHRRRRGRAADLPAGGGLDRAAPRAGGPARWARPRPRSPSSRWCLLLPARPARATSACRLRRDGGRRRRRRAHRRGRRRAARPGRAALRRADPAVLAAGRRLLHLRDVDQRPGAAALHPGRARPRHAGDHGGRRCSPSSASSTSSARSSPAGSPTGSTRGCCCWLLRAARALAVPAAAAVRAGRAARA